MAETAIESVANKAFGNSLMEHWGEIPNGAPNRIRRHDVLILNPMPKPLHLGNCHEAHFTLSDGTLFLNSHTATDQPPWGALVNYQRFFLLSEKWRNHSKTASYLNCWLSFTVLQHQLMQIHTLFDSRRPFHERPSLSRTQLWTAFMEWTP